MRWTDLCRKCFAGRKGMAVKWRTTDAMPLSMTVFSRAGVSMSAFRNLTCACTDHWKGHAARKELNVAALLFWRCLQQNIRNGE